MRRILVIEDEESLRVGMVRALSKMNGVEVRGVGTLREGLESIDATRPDAVISDLDLPDRFGGELLAELERRDLHIPVTFVSAYTRKLGDRIPRSRDVQLVEKPLSIERLREIAGAALAKNDSVLPPPFGAADYLQLACLGRHSVVITHRHQQDDSTPTGRLVVWRGELWDATDDEGDGIPAFRRVVTRAGAFRAHTLDRDPGPRTIEGSWEMLMLDALRLADEAALAASASPDPLEALGEPDVHAPRDPHEPPPRTDAHAKSVVVPPPRAPGPDPYDVAFEAGVDALFERNHVAAIRAFREALVARPGDAKATANLERLAALGHKEPSHDGSSSGGNA
jgi:DNA-binding response OmpR family regulator